MRIEELKNKHIKINSRSITVRDNKGKTCGVINLTELFKNARTTVQMQYFGALRKSSIWGDPSLMGSLIIHNNKCYYMQNLKVIETFETFLKGVSGFESEENHYKHLLNVAASAQQNGIEVIPCYID